MLLSSKLSRFFDPTIRRRGADYQSGGRVRMEGVDEDSAEARVKGTSQYEVALERQGKRLFAWCDCPYAEDFKLCKHVWAVLLEIDRMGLPPEWHEVQEIVAEGEDQEFNDLATGVPEAASKKPGNWREALARVRAQHEISGQDRETWLSRRQVYYFLDLDDEAFWDPQESGPMGGVGLSLAFSDPIAKGGWSKPGFRSTSLAQILDMPPGTDREILALLCGAPPELRASYGARYQALAKEYRLARPQAEALLPRMCSTGRCFIAGQDPQAGAPPLHWDEGPPWELKLGLKQAPAGEGYELDGILQREGAKALALEDMNCGPGFVIAENILGRLSDEGTAPWIRLLKERGRLPLPGKALDEFLDEFFKLPSPPALALPWKGGLQESTSTPRPCLRLEPAHKWRILNTSNMIGGLHFEYEGLKVEPTVNGRLIYLKEKRRVLLRDLTAEREARNRLAFHGFKPVMLSNGAGADQMQIHPSSAAAALRGLALEGWGIEAEGKPYRLASAMRAGLSSGVDWFDLELEADFGGRKPTFPELLRALKAGQGLVTLEGGDLGVLPDDWLKKYGLLAKLGGEKAGTLRFQRGQAGLLDVLLATSSAGESVALDAGFKRLREGLSRFDGLKPEPEPEGFKGRLRPYQREGLAWLHFLREFGLGGCLADDMGLGKTVQVLALLAGLSRHRKGRGLPSLLVVPKSLLFNWREEAARFSPGLRLLTHHGPERAKSAALFDDFDMVLTTYATLRQDILLFKDAEFDTVILDEAQAAKNAEAGVSKATRLLKARHRLALTGTPVENHLGELHNLMDFLNPGLLGPASALGLAAGPAREIDPFLRKTLAKILKPLILRRTKQAVAKELPPKIEQTQLCELDAPQRRLYDELRDHFRASLLKRVDQQGLAKSKMHVLEALLRLRQAACHPGLVDKSRAGESSAKLEALLPQLRELAEEGHKVLVFSQFTSFLAILRRQLEQEGLNYEYLDGKTRDRQARVERFQSDAACPLFLISLKAGGVGLNLTAASYVFLLDPWWNPAVEAQAMDRAHRLGQARQVFAYRLIAKDTVEEKVLALQKEKMKLAEDILNAGGEGMLRGLTREDLERLLG